MGFFDDDNNDNNDISDNTTAPPAAFAVGQRVRVVRDTNMHEAPIGEAVRVERYDPSDRTYRVVDPRTGRASGWIPEADLEAATSLGWDWLRSVLDAEDVALLEAFDGLQQLTLASPIRDRLLRQVPNLRSTILRLTPAAVRASAVDEGGA